MAIQAWRFPTAIRFGVGAREQLAEFRDRFAVARPLVVTDVGLPRTLAYRLVAATLDRVWASGWHSFAGVHPNPVEEDAEAASVCFRERNCDAIVAVGGGSAVDGAKAAILKIVHPQARLADMDLSRFPRRAVPLCALPTTAGTGSEVGQSAVIADVKQGRKLILGAPALLPQLAILDPELTVGLPPELTAATGMDAMTHAIESFVCPVYHPMCDGIALEAIRRIALWLPRAVEHGRDLEARGEMLVAATMGAVAFQKDLGAAHAMAHALGLAQGMHHGLANATVLPATVRFNGEEDPAIYARVAAALGLEVGESPAEQVAGALEALTDRLGIRVRLRDVGVADSALPDLAALAMRDPCRLTNPRPCQEQDFVRLFRAVW